MVYSFWSQLGVLCQKQPGKQQEYHPTHLSRIFKSAKAFGVVSYYPVPRCWSLRAAREFSRGLAGHSYQYRSERFVFMHTRTQAHGCD
jgi:hypothetical protein